MEIAPYINASFTPSAAPAGTTPADHLANGLYAYINADKDPELKKRADATFGRTVPFDNSETQATLIGRSFASHTGYRQNPVQFLRDNKLPIPPNWSGENAQLYTQIGQHIISKYQEHYNNEKIKRDKAIADAQKDITDSFNRLPEAIADSVLRADGITSHTALDKDLLQSLTKYNQGENALTAQKRAALAWQYIAPAFENVDHLQDTNRRLLLDIANALSDEKGQLDPHALAAFVMLTDKKATELQSTNSEFWADFADKFQNYWRTTIDQSTKTGIGSAFAASTLPELQPTWGQQYQTPAYYGDERVEKLYGYMNQAINTAISPSEKAEWYAKLLSEMGGLVGESIVPMAAGIAAGAALAPAGAFAAALAGYGAGVAASAPSTINNAIGNAYIKGVINPELYGTIEGIGQAAAENIGGPATSLKLFTKTAGKLTNYAASRAAGSRFLANQYARTTLNYLTAGAFESVTELAEEELGGFIGSKLNAFARSMGFEVSPQAYQLGETLKDMKSHEVAAIFGYSYTLGLFGVPANFRDARNFAKNTDNLLKAGHTAKTARDIQLKVFQTEDKIADIIANPSLTQEQKDAAIRKEEQTLATYQQNKFTSDILSDPKLRSRLEQEGRNLRDEIEVALDVEHEADLQILKEHNILEAVVIPGEKYKVSIYEPGELQADGTRAPGKITTQEWSRMQLTNWLMLQKDTRIEQDLRAFQSLLLSHAHAQNATLEETKTHFQNLGENRPLAALGELHKHGITPAFFQKAAKQALQLQLQHQQEGMTPQEAAQQPSPDFQGLSLGQVQTLATAASQRAEQEIATTGALQNITEDTAVEYGGINLLAADGTALIKYVAGRATILDMLEERFEADIKQRTRGNQTLLNQLAETLLHIQSHLPGNIQLLDPKKKGNYTKSDLFEAYSKIAIGAFLYNEKNLPINAAGHRLIQNIGRAVDTTRMYQLIGNAWLTYANSPEGKAHLEAGGQTLADIMQQAGFTFSNQLASARATAQQRAQVLEARNYQPDIEQEVKALMDSAQQEQQLAEINEQQSKEPITIPADQSITGKEIIVDPTSSEHGTSVPTSSDLQSQLDRAHNRILSGTGNTSDYTLYLHYNPMTHAEAIQNGICTINQHGNPSAAYTIGRQRSIFKDGKYSHANGQQRDVLTGEVSIAHITHSPDVPQFKRNKAGRESDQSGVVYELPGEYRQHDPIHLWQRTDGTLVVISGRHRLAKAIQAGASYIPATVFPENAQRDTLWARMHDFEQNVLDNQASVADTAVYVAGTNPLNRKLTEKETQEFTRPGSNSELGTYIGLHGSDDLLYCLTRGFISPDYAHRIARLAPDDADVQQQAIGALVQDGKGIQEAENSANIYREIRDSQTGELMFESDQQEEAFNRFLAKYAANKIREIGRAQRPHKAAKSERTIREHEAAGIKFEDAAANRATLQQLTAEQEKWRHPRLHPECMEEARKAFEETDEAKQTYMDFDLFSDTANFSIKAVNASLFSDVKAAKAELKKVQGQTFTNGKVHAVVSGQTIGKTHAAQMSIRNLTDLGYSEEEARKIHYSACTKIHEIFESAPYGFFEPNYDQSNKKGRDGAWHYFGVVNIAGYGEFDVNVSAIKPSRTHGGNSLFTLEMTIENPSEIGSDTLSQRGRALRSEGSSGGRLSAYRSFVEKEMAAIKKKTQTDGAFMLASNGKPTNLTEKQWLTVRTQAFKNWFGDWENDPSNASKVIDSNGEPMVMFHGSPTSGIRVFRNNTALYGDGVFFTESPEEALEYTGLERDDFEDWDEMDEAAVNAGLLYEVFLNIRDDERFYHGGGGTYHARAIAPNEIKSATNNRGTFDGSNPDINFSIRAANPSTLDRFTADPLGERIVHTVRTEARRYARVLGDKTPQEQAMNAIASAESIINAVDKYLHRPDKPVSRRHRNQLTKLRSIIEKYAQIIASGTPRSFKRISPAEQQELQAAIAELEAAELDTAETDPARLIEDSDRTTKRTRDARAAELRRRIVREAAKGRVYKVLAAMLDTAADALDDYLKDQLLTKLHRLTATVAIKRTPSKRLKGKMTAPMYRELEQAIQFMAYSTRQKEDAVDTILTAHETLAQAIASNEDNLTRGNTLLIELAHQLEQEGTPVTAQTLTAALAAHEARVAIFADITSKNYEQTRTAANAIYHIIRYGRALWQQKHEAREAEIQTYLSHFLANTTAEQGTEQATRTASEEEQKESGLTRFANSMMNSMQLFHALSGIDALAPLMEHTQRSLATANVARDLHMKQMVTHVQAVYGRILGIKPATEAGYSDKQLEEISKKLDKFYAENNQREATGITRHYIDADGKHKQEELELTKWQALDLILTYRQQHYRPNAEHHGYTDKVLDALEKWCGTSLMELGEAMQKSLINDGTITVYEEREGIPLRENPLYWPGHLNIAEQDAPDHPVISNPYHGASSYKFLKGRTNNLREVSARNAYNVWKSAIAERANYVYLAPVTDIFNSLLARKEFAARLKTIIGPSLYNQLRLTLREIDGTTWAETSLQEDPHGAVARALRNMTPALLAGNPTTLIRQASAVANATLMPDFPPHEFAKQLVQLQQNQSGITIGRVLKLPVFQARARDNSALNEMLALGTDAKYSSYANLARKFMGYIDAMDTFCNAIGATIYYNYKYEQYTRENNENGNILTDAEIHAKCENDIAIMLALTAQPLKRTDKSAFFWRNSKTVLGPLYLYMGSELINKVGMARANWIKRKAEGMGSIKNTSLWLYSLGAGVGSVAFLTELAVAYLTGNTPDDDDSLSAWLIATYINSAYGQYTSQMPVIGQIVDLFTSPYSSLFGTISQIPGVKTIQSGKKIGKMLTDDKVYSGAEWQAQLTRLARDLNGVAGYAGGVNSHMPWLTVTSSILQSITTAMNIANFFSTGVRNDAFYADWFPDWYKETGTRKRKPRRSKSLVEQWLTPDNK